MQLPSLITSKKDVINRQTNQKISRFNLSKATTAANSMPLNGSLVMKQGATSIHKSQTVLQSVEKVHPLQP